MELINRIRKSRKGFTLVEIIVVLVILAILAAFTIPSMIGFINEAKGKAMIAEAREVYVAAQATATEFKASGKTIAGAPNADNELNSRYQSGTPIATHLAALQMKNYLGTDLIISAVALTATPAANTITAGQSAWLVTLDANYKITQVFYVKNGYAITISQPASGNATTTVRKL